MENINSEALWIFLNCFFVCLFLPPFDKWNFVCGEMHWTKSKKQTYQTFCFPHFSVLKQLFNCPFHLKVEILFHTLFSCLVQRCIKRWDVCFSNASSSLYNVTVRPSDGARLLVDRTTVVQSRSTSSCSSTETLQEIEWTCKENTAKLFIYWILGRPAIVLNHFFFFNGLAMTTWNEVKWNRVQGKSSTAEILHCHEDFLINFHSLHQDCAFTKQLKKSIKSYSFLSF